MRGIVAGLVTSDLAKTQMLYYTFYQDPWCTAGGESCTGPGCCDSRFAGNTLMDPVNWPNCSNGPVAVESVLINPLAPNQYGGIDMDYIGSYYAAGSHYYDVAGVQRDWRLNETVINCGGSDHDNPYSYNLPAGNPSPNPLCVPATPPTAIKNAIAGLQTRGIRAGISLLGGGGADNPPPTLQKRNHMERLLQLEESDFSSWITQLRAAGTVLNNWGITHFDIDFEGGLTQTLNCTALSRVLDALRFNGSIVSVTTEYYELSSLSCVTSVAESRPDIIQLMMGNYYTTWATGIQQINNISSSTGYPVSQFRLGIKPQCGVSTGSLSYVTGALPNLVASGARPMLWNMGRDYPCSGSCSSGTCQRQSPVGQQPFTTEAPFAWTCAISDAFQPTSTQLV